MGAGGSAGAAAAYEISGQSNDHPFVDEAAALAAGKTQEEINEYIASLPAEGMAAATSPSASRYDEMYKS